MRTDITAQLSEAALPRSDWSPERARSLARVAACRASASHVTTPNPRFRRSACRGFLHCDQAGSSYCGSQARTPVLEPSAAVRCTPGGFCLRGPELAGMPVEDPRPDQRPPCSPWTARKAPRSGCTLPMLAGDTYPTLFRRANAHCPCWFDPGQGDGLGRDAGGQAFPTSCAGLLNLLDAQALEDGVGGELVHKDHEVRSVRACPSSPAHTPPPSPPFIGLHLVAVTVMIPTLARCLTIDGMRRATRPRRS